MFKMNLKPYEKYKDSGVEWLGKIPAHWEVLPTKRIFKLITEPAPKNNNMELLSVYTDIGVKPRNELEERGNKATTTDYYWLVKKGDLIVNKLLAWMGAVGISEYDGVTSPAYDVLRKTKKLNSYYYHFLLRNPFTHQELKKYSKGIMDVRLRLYFSEFGHIMLPLPPLEIQNLIVEYLNRKTQQAEAFIEKQTRMIELLKEQKKAIINKAVTKGLNPDAPMKDSGIEWLGEIPGHWEVKKLKYIGKAIIGITYRPQEEVQDCGILVLRASNIQNGELELTDCVYVNKKIPNDLITQRGDILICSRNGSRELIGKNIVIDESIQGSTFGAFMTVFRTKIFKFISKFFQSQVFIGQSGLFSTSTINQLTVSTLNNFYIALPSITEQHQIVSYIETKTAKIDQAIEKAEKEISFVKEYLQSLVYQVVTGRLRIE